MTETISSLCEHGKVVECPTCKDGMGRPYPRRMGFRGIWDTIYWSLWNSKENSSLKRIASLLVIFTVGTIGGILGYSGMYLKSTTPASVDHSVLKSPTELRELYQLDEKHKAMVNSLLSITYEKINKAAKDEELGVRVRLTKTWGTNIATGTAVLEIKRILEEEGYSVDLLYYGGLKDVPYGLQVSWAK
jgi:hypothetical protein